MTAILWLPQTLLQEFTVNAKFTLIEVTSRDGTKHQRQYIVISDDDKAEVVKAFNRRTLSIQDRGFSRRNVDAESRAFCKTDFSVIPPCSQYVELWIAEVGE